MFPLKLASELQNLVKKIPIRYEDINKIQTEFPPSGKFPRSGTHTRPPWFMDFSEISVSLYRRPCKSPLIPLMIICQ